MDARQRDALIRVLDRSRELGFLGPGPLERQIEHALGFAAAAGGPVDSYLDLGAGGGLPGLVLAVAWPTASGALLDAAERRTEFLSAACVELGIADRIRVIGARAEDAARDPRLRRAFAVVTARSFARPAVTAECAVGFLRPGGRLVVSDPPSGAEQRWPDDALTQLGLSREGSEDLAEQFSVLLAGARLEERWPRRVGVPAKRPLW